MLIDEFRRALAAELEAVAQDMAVQNGLSQTRTIETLRYNAGFAAGLNEAASRILSFAHDGEDQ